MPTYWFVNGSLSEGWGRGWEGGWCRRRQRYHIKPGGRVLPYMGYIGMCGPKGYGFSAVLVINKVSILADFGHK